MQITQLYIKWFWIKFVRFNFTPRYVQLLPLGRGTAATSRPTGIGYCYLNDISTCPSLYDHGCLESMAKKITLSNMKTGYCSIVKWRDSWQWIFFFSIWVGHQFSLMADWLRAIGIMQRIPAKNKDWLR